jgi:hypothetical protein
VYRQEVDALRLVEACQIAHSRKVSNVAQEKAMVAESVSKKALLALTVHTFSFSRTLSQSFEDRTRVY